MRDFDMRVRHTHMGATAPLVFTQELYDMTFVSYREIGITKKKKKDLYNTEILFKLSTN